MLVAHAHPSAARQVGWCTLVCQVVLASVSVHGQGLYQNGLDISPTRTFPGDGEGFSTCMQSWVPSHGQWAACVADTMARLGGAAIATCKRWLTLGLVCCAVGALHAFYQAVVDRTGRLASWQLNTDPCGAPTCVYTPLPASPAPSAAAPNASGQQSGAPPAVLCNWSGISCDSWRVTKIHLPCKAMDTACAGLQGQMPSDFLATMQSLTVLDLQVRSIPVTC